jgi:transposase
VAPPHPIELRERAVHAYVSGDGSYAVLAARFGIARRILQNWVQRWRDTNSVAPMPLRGGNRSPVSMAVLHGVLGERADLTTHELAAIYNQRVPRASRVHRSSILRALHRAGYVFKKNGLVLQSKTGRTFKRGGATTSAG